MTTTWQPWQPAPTPPPADTSHPLPAVTTDYSYGTLLDGTKAPIYYLDHGASAATIVAVELALTRSLCDMAAIHRGPGELSQACTGIYEDTRAIVADMVGAPHGSCVILTSGTTSALNILAYALGPDAEVIGSAENHHANILPWPQRCNYTALPVPHSQDDMLRRYEHALRRLPRGKRKYITITGAGNVTGEMPDLRAFADLGRAYDAQLIVDAAQLVPHQPVNMARDGIAALAFSGHKIGGTSAALGALIVPREWMTTREPLIRGGGAVDFVHPDGVQWSADPTVRHEAGSPNVPGAIALGVACLTHMQAGMHRIAEHEAGLLQYAYEGLQKIPGITIYQMWPWEHPRVGVLTFNVDRYPHGLLAAILSCEYGIATRAGVSALTSSSYTYSRCHRSRPRK